MLYQKQKAPPDLGPDGASMTIAVGQNVMPLPSHMPHLALNRNRFLSPQQEQASGVVG